MILELPEELALLQRTVRDFTEDVLQPHSREVEEQSTIPRSLIDAMAKVGLFGVPFAEDCGGSGLGKLGYVVAVEQLSRTNAAFWNVVGASAGLCGIAVDVDGSADLKHRYLMEIATGRKIGAYALSEPGSGSDAASLTTAARRDGDDYVINRHLRHLLHPRSRQGLEGHLRRRRRARRARTRGRQERREDGAAWFHHRAAVLSRHARAGGEPNR
ncbi:MAG: hypothetical protein E6I87_03840 [Chloroflexi bacterium]|nr:MAG: hypothetical protein E6I87_03840 [Chloroflexota bacterium]